MAILPTVDRQRIWRGLMRWWSKVGQAEPLAGCKKQDLQDAVNAADAWVDGNAAAYNAALPVTFRTNATANQKSLLLVAVILMRHNLTLLKLIFGEVD